ncbi:MAG: hemerythrin domain-containing protein [Bacteroidetes bacterium]|nr:hemerythrin domain-containing protein [Bacteroidota bacterium]
MKRYNLFYQIHKGLRALMYETALLIQQTDFANSDERRFVKKQTETLLALFEKHADTEDNQVFSAVKSWEPAVADAFEQEHVKDHALGVQLQVALDALETTGDAVLAGQELNIAFVAFMVFNLDHMAREEDVINQILWRYYSDAELHELTMRIVSAIVPEKLALYNKWMIRGLSNPEITTWLREIKEKAPHFVFDGLLKQIEEELPAARSFAIAGSLTDGLLVA